MDIENDLQKFQTRNLRDLTEKDMLFLIEAYASRRKDYNNIASIIKGDEEIICRMIDSERVFNKVMECKNRIIEISPYFLFSLLLRKSFRENRKNQKFIDIALEQLNSSDPLIPWNEKRLMDMLKDNGIANYMANMLAQFTKSFDLFKTSQSDKENTHHIVDMIEDSIKSDNKRKFYIFCHIGDYSLFLTGMLSNYIEYGVVHKQMLLDKDSYVSFGKVYYSLASETDSAKKNMLADTLSQLSECFEVFVQVLHFMNRKYFLRN